MAKEYLYTHYLGGFNLPAASKATWALPKTTMYRALNLNPFIWLESQSEFSRL
jgi:hypothetical protein